jgi:hypothetical protein
MMEKKVVALTMIAFSGVVAYEFSTSAPSNVSSQVSQQLPSDEQSVIAVEDCLDCMEVVPDSCEYETNECLDAQDCSEWFSCTEDCVRSQGDQSCYDDCDVAHSDSHSSCTSMKSCMCDVCTGQCVDMCMADG